VALDLRQIRCFVAVARHGSFVAAGAALHVSQPAVGQQVRSLEARLGTPLLERHARGVRLTRAGEAFLPHAEGVLERLSEAEAAMTRFRGVRVRKLAVAATPSAGRELGPHIVAACADHTELQLSFRLAPTDEALRQMAEGRLDVALCYQAAPDAARTAPLYSESFCLVGPAELLPATGSEIPFRDLAEYRLILDPAVRRLMEPPANTLGVRLDVVAEAEPAGITLELMARSRCCSILSRGLLAEEIAARRVSCLKVREPELVRTLYLNAGPEASSEDVDLLLDLLKPVIQRQFETGELGWCEPAAGGA
jgi:LysR family transcriptional regulator, nitrogen assimilation regulatory protein